MFTAAQVAVAQMPINPNEWIKKIRGFLIYTVEEYSATNEEKFGSF